MTTTATMSVIIAGAGTSERFGADLRKPFVTLGRKPILFHSIDTYGALPEVSEIIVAVNREDIQYALDLLGPRLKKCRISAIMEGGKERFDTVAMALAAVNPQSPFVAVHDAARPLITAQTIRRIFAAAQQTGAAIPALEMTDTVKITKNGCVDVTLDRSNLRAIQTPQIFRRDWFVGAYAHYAGNHFHATDDAQILEVAGYPVEMVPGDPTNIKITHPHDLALARALLSRRAQDKAK